MTKSNFKVGDRVRVRKGTFQGRKSEIGKAFTITKVFLGSASYEIENYYYTGDEGWTKCGWWGANLELADDAIRVGDKVRMTREFVVTSVDDLFLGESGLSWSRKGMYEFEILERGGTEDQERKREILAKIEELKAEAEKL